MKILYCFWASTVFLISCGNKDAAKNNAPATPASAIPVSQVVGIGKIEPRNEIIQLSAPVNGIVQKILASENDTIAAGAPLLELDHQLEDARLAQLSSEVATQANQVRADEAAVQEYEARYSNAAKEVERLQRLLAKGAETQQAVDDATTGLKSFQSNLRKMQANVTVSKSRLDQTRGALQVARVERDQKIVRSPVSGKILELTPLIGGSVDTRQSLGQIQPSGRTIAVCEVDELFAGQVGEGQTAWVRNVGSRDTLSTGKVYFASSFLKKKSLFTDQAGEKEDRRVRTIKIMLDDPGRLLLNARTECVIDISGNLKK
jgi:multidrug resistance efflux pump